jgi:hypothetical protein
MESERYKREEVTLSEDMQWIDFKMDKLYWEIKNLQGMQTPPVNYLAVITVSILSSALISFLFYMLSK